MEFDLKYVYKDKFGVEWSDEIFDLIRIDFNYNIIIVFTKNRELLLT